MNNILVATFIQFKLLMSASQDKKILLNSFHLGKMLSLIAMRQEIKPQK